MAYSPMTKDRKDSARSNYVETGGSYKPGEFYRVGDVIPDLGVGDRALERNQELYNLGIVKPGVYLPQPSDFGSGPITQASRPKREVRNAVYNGCP